MAGIGLAAIGALLLLAEKVPGIRLFRLPGDIRIEREGASIYIPIVSMLLISGVLTLLLWLFGWMKK